MWSGRVGGKGYPSLYIYVFLGILVDTVSCTLSVTKERLDEMSSLVEDWLIRSKYTLKELQSLLGKLHFVSTCVRPGRLFVSRLLTWLKTFGGQNVSKKIPKYVKLDLVWWSNFLIIYNGVSMMFLQNFSTPDCILSCDSTLVGCGGLCGDLYFHKIFPRFIQKKQLHINVLELLCLVVSLKLWTHRLRGLKVVIYCDNSSSVTVVNSGACRNSFMQSCLREICFLAASYEFVLKCRHLTTVENRLADLLSRWDLHSTISEEFLNHAQNNAWSEVIVEDELFLFSAPW